MEVNHSYRDVQIVDTVDVQPVRPRVSEDTVLFRPHHTVDFLSSSCFLNSLAIWCVSVNLGCRKR